jgi:hypothetical protein
MNVLFIVMDDLRQHSHGVTLMPSGYVLIRI